MILAPLAPPRRVRPGRIRPALTLLAALVALVTVRSARADDRPAEFHTLRLDLGWSRHAVLDRRATDLTYIGHTPTLGLGWELRRGGNIFSVRLRGGGGPYYAKQYHHREFDLVVSDLHGTETLHADARGLAFTGSFAFTYLRRLLRPEARRPGLALGATLSDDFFYPQGFLTPGLMHVAALSPALALEQPLGGRGLLTVGVRMPVLAVVSRMPYHGTVSRPDRGLVGGFVSQGTEVESLGRFRQVQLSLALQHRLGRRWIGGLAYEATYTHDAAPAPLRSMQHSLHLSIAFDFSAGKGR